MIVTDLNLIIVVDEALVKSQGLLDFFFESQSL